MSKIFKLIENRKTDDCLKFIAKGKFKPDIKDSRLNTPLIAACNCNLPTVAMTILRKYDNFSQTEKFKPTQVNMYGQTALMYASKNGMTNVVLELIKSTSVDYIDRVDDSGNNALMTACSFKHTNIAMTLIEHMNTFFNFNKLGITTMHIASRNKMPDIISLITQKTAEIPNLTPYINHTDRHGDTALNLACFYNDLDTVVNLLQAGAKANIVNIIGLSPLILATQKGNLDIVLELLETNKVMPGQCDHRRKTALIYACEKKHGDIALTLLNRYGTRLNYEQVDYLGNDALSYATKNKLDKVINELNALFESYYDENDLPPATPIKSSCRMAAIDHHLNYDQSTMFVEGIPCFATQTTQTITIDEEIQCNMSDSLDEDRSSSNNLSQRFSSLEIPAMSIYEAPRSFIEAPLYPMNSLC